MFGSITATIQQQVYAGKDKDKDDDDDDDKNKGYEKGERKLAEAMDMIDDISSTSDLVEMCQYMKKVGHYKQSTNCLDWAMDETVDHQKIIKNFAILKGYGLYD
jgi:hypothetical protein